MITTHPSVYRASILHFLDDPEVRGNNAYAYYEDGALVVDEGKIVALGEAQPILDALDHPANLLDYRGSLLMPGMIDCHAHYAQLDIMASFGDSLLDWLNHYTFPAEALFKDPRHALAKSEHYLDTLLANGTTSALVFGTVHKTSVEAFFEAAHSRNMRMVCGQVLMDRNAPSNLCQSAQQSHTENQELIQKWHQRGRQHYAITPRFAITSSPEQLELAGALAREHPALLIHSHLSENKDEIALVSKLFPNMQDYLSVYEHHGLVTDRSMFAHGVHLTSSESKRLAHSGASIAFCPSANNFLGSGFADLAQFESTGLNWGIASDVGAGTRLCMLEVLAEAYKVGQQVGYTLSPLNAFYRVTRGNAERLHLQDKIGSFSVGMEADFVVLDLHANDVLSNRIKHCETLEDTLFALMMLGDNRAIQHTYVAGKHRYQRPH